MSKQPAGLKADTENDHRVVDVLVVGSGAGGFVAALAAKAHGLDVLMIEKARVVGGSSALSGGGMWVPNAPMFKRLGEEDDPQRIFDYLDAIAGDVVARERIMAYVEQAPRMMEFLEDQGEYFHDAFFWTKGYSDYHPDKGGNPDGRGVWAKPIDRRLLGDDMKLLRPGWRRLQLPLGAWMTAIDLHDLIALRWGGTRGWRLMAKLGWRVARARVLGERIGAMGQALMTRLLLTTRQKGIPLIVETPMRSLIQDESGAVIGVEAESDGRPIRIEARRAVILATGGFDHNLPMRVTHQPEITDRWSMGSPDNQGDGHIAGEAAGAALALMDDAWWYPTVKMPDGTLWGTVAERQYPGQFIVNQSGRRFVNEAAPYTDFVHDQIAGHRTGLSHIPAWMIFDQRAWKRNLILGHLPGLPLPKAWLDGNVMYKAETLEELAGEIGVPPATLRETADRFNGFARSGRDDDFHRGESAYGRYYGDPSYPNPNLAEISKPPFYAVALTPGDLGTKGGLLVNEKAQVLRVNGSTIEGLYAVGNVSAAVMGNSYAGPGSTLGSAMTFAFIAANTIAESHLSAIEPTMRVSPPGLA